MAFNIHAVNKKAQTEGVWADFEGSRFLIASTANSKYQRRIATLRKPMARRIDKGTVDPEELTEMLATALSEHILLDWEGVEGEKNAEIELLETKEVPA